MTEQQAVKKRLFLSPDQPRGHVRDRLAGWAEVGVLACLALLAAGLPFAAITTTREVGLLGGLLFWAARMVLSGKWDLVRTPLDLPLALFLATGLFSLVTAIDPGYSLHELRGEMLKGILIYYLAVNNLRTEARARVVLLALAAGVVVMDVYGVIHFFSSGGGLISAGVREAGLHRGNQELATYLVQMGPYLILGLFWLKGRRNLAIVGAVLALHFLMAHVTFNRIALVALVIEVGLILFLAGLSWKIVLGSLVGAVLVLALVMPRPIIVLGDKQYEGLARVGGIGVLGLEGSRLEMWKTAVNHLRLRPFTGLGFGRRSYTKGFPEMKGLHHNYWHAHNAFLNLAVELGLQGLAAFCFILYRIFTNLWPGRGLDAVWRRAGTAGFIITGAWVMTAGYFIRNLTDDIYNNDAALLFWLLVGCAFSMKRFVLDSPAGKPQGLTGPH